MIVKNLIEQMNGTIQLQSDGNHGTTIIITLRLDRGDLTASTLAVERQNDETIRLLAGKRVLVVEDSELNAEIEKAILEKAGMMVEVAENGQVALDAIKAADENQYAAILMDIRMPVMGGIEATIAIRSLAAAWCKTIPIIAVTADAFDENVRRFLDCGMDDCLTKPIDVAKLYQVLAEKIGSR